MYFSIQHNKDNNVKNNLAVISTQNKFIEMQQLHCQNISPTASTHIKESHYDNWGYSKIHRPVNVTSYSPVGAV